jgi:predicted permease
MSLWRKLAYLLPHVRRAADRDMQDELRALGEMAGRRELGNLTIAAEDARAAYGWMWLERLGQDVRYALRSMHHYRAFTLLVVLSLGLGIGANTAIFSFTESILLRSLPVRDPETLVVMKWRAKSYELASHGMSWSTGGSFHDDETDGTVASIFPYAALQVFAGSDTVLSDAFGYFALERLSVTTADATDSAKGHYVTGHYFQGLGVMPAAGRLIQPSDDVAGAPPVAVVSHEFSRRRFGDPHAAVGQTIRVNTRPFVVVGVAPPGFAGAEPGATVDVFLPVHALPDDLFWGPTILTDEHLYWMEIMGRRRPGVTLAQAQAALTSRFHQFVEGTATTERQRQDLPALMILPGGAGLDSLRRQYAQPIYVLTGMVGLILLIACSNVASLLLTRASTRRREIAVRLSIGASRARVVRQLLTESVLLSVAGGIIGVALAWWGIGVLAALLAGGRDYFALRPSLNLPVLGVTAALSVATGLVFGLAPALQATRIDIAPVLKDARLGQTASSPRRLGLGPLLVGAQVALSLLLLVAAGLFGRTLANLHAINIGFNPDRVLLFSLRPGSAGYAPEARTPFFEDLRQRLAVMPGVDSVSLSTQPFPMGGGTTAAMTVDGVSPAADATGRTPQAVLATVGPDFFRTMQIPIEAGRDMTAADRAGARRVAVVNHQFLRAFGLTSAVGHTVSGPSRREESWEIVGVVDDSVAFALKEEDRWPILYTSYLQLSSPGQMTYAVRTAGNPLDLAAPVRDLVRQIDRRLAVHEMQTERVHINEAISREITLARLGSLLAVVALVIASVGLYGTVAFNVTRRTNEIGIRMALGAQAGRIVSMVVSDVLLVALGGLAVGLGLALVGSRYVTSLLYGIQPNDPVSIILAVSVLLASGLVAAFGPARRASQIDPMSAVRHE